MPTKQLSRETRSLRAVLDNPALPALIQSLPARDLAQLCARIGIGDAAQIMALAPAERLVQALEVSVWKTPRPGMSEVFDPRELIEWIGAWLEIGETFTAQRLAAVPDENLMLYLSQLASVSTTAMWGFERSTEIEDLDRIYAPSHDETTYGPYVVSARQHEDWEILRGSLDAMWADAPERLLHLLSQLVGDESMAAPQRNRASSNEDVVAGRDTARERRGYVTANGARAFLAQARAGFEELSAACGYDLETQHYLTGLADGDPQVDAPEVTHLATLHTALEDVGLLEPRADRVLLRHEASSRQLAVVTLLQALAAADAAQFDARAREVAYLGSVLIAGIAIDGHTFSPTQARDAVLATCNLGLEMLSAHGGRVRIEDEPGLVRLFLVGFGKLSACPPRSLSPAFGICRRCARPAPNHCTSGCWSRPNCASQI
ncbi:MAG TPA: DUF6178 family protein [Steroidobacteraceae bacterium]|jgi:hypothetical protein|nr:DUF6178 family protein [Steroidobacteraceae bacterium]